MLFVPRVQTTLRPWEARSPRFAAQEHVLRVMGLDLGQSFDHSAAVIGERRTCDPNFIGPREPRIRIRSLRQWKLKTDYCDVVEDALAASVDVIAVEFNGVGRPVVDVMRKRALELGWKGRVVPIVTAASNARTKEKTETRGTHWVVPKIDLVSSITLVQQDKRIILPACEEYEELKRQLSAFRMRITKSAHVKLGNVPGKGMHDDMVIALGLCLWWLIRFGRRSPAICVG